MPQQPSQQYQIESPKDAFVVKVVAISGTSVNAGDAICSLDTEGEDHFAEGLLLSKTLLALEQAKVAPDFVNGQRQILETANQVAQTFLDYAHSKYIIAVEKEQLGMVRLYRRSA
jgi:pyruvate/2-oxoglutarate dehydrogenase complex dihydrolipoamide acyltransferase (E2) component